MPPQSDGAAHRRRHLADDLLTLYCSTQGVTFTAGLIGRALGLDPQRVKVISPHVGGGFGAKVYPTAYAVLAALAVSGRAVKFTLTRQQMFSLAWTRWRSRAGWTRSRSASAMSRPLTRKEACRS